MIDEMDSFEIDQCYKIFDLKPGASEDEVKRAYKDLVNVWHPDRFSNNPHLELKAQEKLKEINIAYKKLMSHFAWARQQNMTSSNSESQATPKEQPSAAKEEQSTKKDGADHKGSQTPPNQSTAHHSPAEKRLKPWSSWPNLSFICLYGFTFFVRSFSKYGLSWYAIGTSIGLSLIPLLFVIRYNLIRGENKTAKNISVGVNALFALIMLFSSIQEIKKSMGPAETPQVEVNANVTPPAKDVENISKAQSQTQPGKPSAEQVSNSPGGANYFFNQGEIHLSMRNWTQAVENYKKAILLNPNLPVAHGNLGVAYYELGRFQDAIESYRQAIRIRPDLSTIHNNLGLAYSRLGRHSEAMEAYKQSIQLSPNDAIAHCSMGWAYFDLGRYEEAVGAFKQATQIKPDYADAYAGLGMAYTKLRRFQEALKAHKEATQLKPDDAVGHYNLGIAYLNIGDRFSALKEYEILKIRNKDLAIQLHAFISNRQ